MIIAEGLCKAYDDFLAVDGVSFNVQPGQVLVLLGPNGAGKTTTVRMLSSVLRPTCGRATVAGFDVAHQPEKVRASVGVLTEQHGLYGRMDAEEYLAFYGRLYGLSDDLIAQRAAQLLEEFGLAEARLKRLGEFSKGMRQKLALVRTLLHNPPVLLLDEPTSALDPESTRAVRNVIEQMRSNERTIVLCTHNLSEAEELGDQVAIIRRGRILYNGQVADFLSETLGAPQFEARLNGTAPETLGPLPNGAQLTERGENWLRFRVDNPSQDNPAVLRALLAGGLEVVSFQEAPRNLEQAYLEALARASGKERHD